MIVLNRTIQSDSRVSQPLVSYREGCSDVYAKAYVQMHSKCCGLYLAQGKVDEAYELFKQAGINEKVSEDDILEIWRHVLFGSLMLSNRQRAWKELGAVMKEFVNRIEREYQVIGLSKKVERKITYYNANLFTRIVRSVIRRIIEQG